MNFKTISYISINTNLIWQNNQISIRWIFAANINMYYVWQISTISESISLNFFLFYWWSKIYNSFQTNSQGFFILFYQNTIQNKNCFSFNENVFSICPQKQETWILYCFPFYSILMIPVVSENWSLPKFAIFDDFSMFQTSPVQCSNLKNHQKASTKNKELIQLVFNSLHQ